MIITSTRMIYHFTLKEPININSFWKMYAVLNHPDWWPGLNEDTVKLVLGYCPSVDESSNQYASTSELQWRYLSRTSVFGKRNLLRRVRLLGILRKICCVQLNIALRCAKKPFNSKPSFLPPSPTSTNVVEPLFVVEEKPILFFCFFFFFAEILIYF